MGYAMDRILEIGHQAAGYCGRLFAQTGHDVVRVEPADPSPTWVSQRSLDLFLHAGKRRIATDDPALIGQLARNADVVIVEAANADAVLNLGVDAWQTKVTVVITPFGLTGPKRNWQATPSTLLAMGGYTNLMGDADRAPLTLPGHYPEFQSGQYAFTAASACRWAHASNAIDISIFETVMSLSQFTTVMWHCTGQIRGRHGNDFHWVVPSTLFRLADGWVYVNIVPTFWDAFTTCIDRPTLILDERFASNDLRMANRDALHALVADALATLTREEIQTRATEHRIPIGVLQTLDDVLADAHLAEREFFQTATDGSATVRSPCLPFRFDREPRVGQVLEAVEVASLDKSPRG